MTIDTAPVLREALEWTGRGHYVVPVPAGEKGPREQGWQHLRLTVGQLPGRFAGDAGLGLLLGITGLVDVDLDCREARALAPLLLPATGRRHGRPSAPESHWWYRCDAAPITTQFDDPGEPADGATARLLEVRGISSKRSPQQTLIPPSRHPAGELIGWSAAGEPASAPAIVLLRRAALVAACAVVARTWPGQGRRHSAALHLAGVLCRRRLTEGEVAAIVETVADLAGDEEADRRRQDAIDTYRTYQTGNQTSGLPQLLETLAATEDQKGRLAEWFGVGDAFPVVRDYANAKPIAGLVPAAAAIAPTSGNGNRPQLYVGEQDLAKITPEAWEAVRHANAPHRLFRYGETVVRLQHSDAEAPILVELTEDRLRHELARAALCYKLDRNGATQKARPPMDLVADMLAVPEPPLPVLTRIVEAPVFAADGTLQTEPGYHPASRTFYAAPAGLRIPRVTPRPTTGELDEIRQLLFGELFADFPFVSQADRAGAVALFLLAYCRDFIPGPTPNHLIEAPEPGSGKGLLAEAAVSPAVGRSVGGITEARDDDEWRKRITAVLRDGTSVVLIDNVRRSLDSASLASALTQMEWRDRLLGRSEIISFPIRCIWVTTANNPTMTTEMARRCIRIRLDAQRDQPWRRPLAGFRHPDLRSWVARHRAQLVWAALTLVQHWLSAGRPEATVRPLGSYEAWSQVMGGILSAAGISGFLENLDELYADVDSHGQVWRTFVGLWWQKHGPDPVTSAALFPLSELVEGLPISGQTERGLRTSFGRQLNAQRDRVIGGYRVLRAGVTHSVGQYRLEPVEGGPGGPGGLISND